MLGTYGTTSRPQITVRRRPREGHGNLTPGPFRQVQRMGNPLINELIIGTGSKDRFSMDDPDQRRRSSSSFFAAAAARRHLQVDRRAGAGGPRTDLAPLVHVHRARRFPPARRKGPVADLLRINTGIPPTPPRGSSASAC